MMDYLQLAYLAELAAAYNLAFGEFKHEKQALDLLDKFNCFNQATIYDYEEAKNIQKNKSHKNKLVNNELNDIGLYIKALREFISIATKEVNKEYNSFFVFCERVKVFAIDIESLTSEKKSGWKYCLKSLISKFINYSIAIIPSWGFSKTAIWKFKPSTTCCTLWVFIIFAIFLVIKYTTFLPNNIWIYSILGAITILFAPRPFCRLISFVFRTSDNRIRAKDYPKALFFIITILLVFMTLHGHHNVEEDDKKYWWYLMGVLIFSILYPLMLTLAYELIDDRIDKIAKFVSNVNSQDANDELEKVSKENSNSEDPYNNCVGQNQLV